MTASIQTSGSIRRRLSLLLAGSAAVLAIILFLIVQQFVRQIAEESQDNILVASATSILDSVSSNAHELSVDIPYAALSMLGTVSDDRVFYQVTANNNHLTGYPDLPDLPSGSGNNGSFTTARYLDDSIRLVQLSRPLTLKGKSINVAVKVAQTQNAQALQLAKITRSTLYPGIGFFLLAILLAIFAARSSVRPLRQLAKSVSRRGPDDLRPVSSPVPAEMVPLVSSLNTFIDRLKTTLSRSEDFIAEAAHRVRTPLATVRTQAEVALLSVEKPENRNSLKEMIRAIDESSRAANQLLDHAMVTFRTGQSTSAPLDLRDLTLELVDRLQPIADLKDITIQVHAPDSLQLNADNMLLQSAIRNIIENAIKYSPHDDAVTVEIRKQNGQFSICVTDNGSGFPATGAQHLITRFTRGDNVGNSVGSGLGLTIADEVATAHRGHLTLNNNPAGVGARVCLVFPI